MHMLMTLSKPVTKLHIRSSDANDVSIEVEVEKYTNKAKDLPGEFTGGRTHREGSETRTWRQEVQ